MPDSIISAIPEYAKLVRVPQKRKSKVALVQELGLVTENPFIPENNPILWDAFVRERTRRIRKQIRKSLVDERIPQWIAEHPERQIREDNVPKFVRMEIASSNEFQMELEAMLLQNEEFLSLQKGMNGCPPYIADRYRLFARTNASILNEKINQQLRETLEAYNCGLFLKYFPENIPDEAILFLAEKCASEFLSEILDFLRSGVVHQAIDITGDIISFELLDEEIDADYLADCIQHRQPLFVASYLLKQYDDGDIITVFEYRFYCALLQALGVPEFLIHSFAYYSVYDCIGVYPDVGAQLFPYFEIILDSPVLNIFDDFSLFLSALAENPAYASIVEAVQNKK